MGLSLRSAPLASTDDWIALINVHLTDARDGCRNRRCQGGDNRSGSDSTQQRNFGVTWGNWVALCNYSTIGGSRAPRITEEGNSPPDDLMRALTSSQSLVEVVKKVYSNSRVTPLWKQVYVLIPDLHLPVVTRTPN